MARTKLFRFIVSIKPGKTRQLSHHTFGDSSTHAIMLGNVNGAKTAAPQFWSPRSWYLSIVDTQLGKNRRWKHKVIGSYVYGQASFCQYYNRNSTRQTYRPSDPTADTGVPAAIRKSNNDFRPGCARCCWVKIRKSPEFIC
jgi:hypothetical protein